MIWGGQLGVDAVEIDDLGVVDMGSWVLPWLPFLFLQQRSSRQDNYGVGNIFPG